MKFRKGMYTPEQQAWCVLYEARTGFDPMMDDFEAGNETFYEGAQKSVRWFEDHAADAINAISRDVPGWDAAFSAACDARDAARQR
ncbi:hypothetical protein [Paraburkholderia tropica]|uniref:hypothetical protein n=1 Tax=Paraburkholderia tropica TaxID=92647 RepID=UPI002AB68A3F|nr:hypothetical protein [Paraburkholderia tropica]